MDLEQRLQALLIEREQTLTRLTELVQQIQNSLTLLAQQREHQHRLKQRLGCFENKKN